jgi:hypothetical protein
MPVYLDYLTGQVLRTDGQIHLGRQLASPADRYAAR